MIETFYEVFQYMLKKKYEHTSCDPDFLPQAISSYIPIKKLLFTSVNCIDISN